MSLPNPFDFTGKTVVLAGATGGLGRPISLAFAETGANLALRARGEPALAELAAELGGARGGLMTAKVDLCDEQQVGRFTDAVKASDAARWINGHTMNVDTGFNVT